MCISAVFQQCFVPSFKIGRCQAWILLCPEQDAGLFVILVTFFSGHLFVALRFCSSWELFPSHRSLSWWWQLFQRDWTISTFPISASCHWETDHLGGTGVSSEWWEVVNSFYFCLSFVFPLFSTRLSVHFRHGENIVAGFCSDLLVQSLFFNVGILICQTQKWVAGLSRVLGGSQQKVRWKVGASCADSQAPAQGAGIGGNPPPQPGRNRSRCWRQQFCGGSWRTAEINPDSWKRDSGWVQDPFITPDMILQQTQRSACFENRDTWYNYCWARESTVKIDKLVSCVNCADGRAEGPAGRLKKTLMFEMQIVRWFLHNAAKWLGVSSVLTH